MLFPGPLRLGLGLSVVLSSATWGGPFLRAQGPLAERSGEARRASRQMSITDFGAVGDGATVNTKAIQDAIDRCSAQGGGVLVIPKGTFLSGALFFKPRVNLRVERDAVLKSTTAMADFPPIYTRWEGMERYWTSAFLNFIGLENVEVGGEGVIDGSGEAFPRFGPSRRDSPQSLEGNMPAQPTPLSEARSEPLPQIAEAYPGPLPTTALLAFAPDRAHLPPVNAAGIALPRLGNFLSPPRALVFQNCTGVHLSGLTLKNNARWGFVFLYCDEVVAEKLTVRAAHTIPSSDGMDIDSCRHVLVTGCDFDCNDDCLSIKSGKDEDGRRVNRPCEDVVIEKTRFAYGHGGAAMGSETSGGIRNIEVRDCVAEAGNWAPIRFKSQPSRGGIVENITYRNLELRGVRQALEFELEWNMKINTAGSARMPPVVRNVVLINVHGSAQVVGKIAGLTDSPIDGIRFQNCEITAKKGLVIGCARNVDTSGLTLHVADGPAIITQPP